jgi:hypothetical protein
MISNPTMHKKYARKKIAHPYPPVVGEGDLNMNKCVIYISI